MSVRSFLSIAAMAAALGVHSATAAVLTVSSYDMPNGDGTNMLGTWNYWDGTYTGSGAKTTDSAPLTGGTGALTNGIIGTTGWDGLTGTVANSNSSGTGQYVGWKYLNPVIVFNLAQTSRVFSIDVFGDYAYGGLVGPIKSIKIGTNTYNPTVSLLPGSATDARFSVSFPGGIVGSTFTVQLNAGPANAPGSDVPAYNAGYLPQYQVPLNGPEPWIMVSEVQFNGTPVNAVPEPSTWTLMLIGFAALGYISYRRKTRAAFVVKRLIPLRISSVTKRRKSWC